MADKTQYEVIKAAYDEELKRYSDLNDKGKFFLGICTFFIGGSALKLNDVFSGSCWCAYWSFALAFVLFTVSFLLVVSAMTLAPYETMFDPYHYIDKLGPTPPSDEEFFDDRIADIAVAYRRNVEENDKRAKRLQRASYTMFVGIVLGFASLLMVYLHGDLQPVRQNDGQQQQGQRARGAARG